MSSHLYVIIDRATCERFSVKPEKLCGLAIEEKVAFIQYRDKSSPVEARRAQVRQLEKMCRETRTRFIVNDDLPLAIELGCGLHLGQEDLKRYEADIPKLREKDIFWGLSTHNHSEIETAVRFAPDYIGFGAVFSSSTKKTVPVAFPFLGEAIRAWEGPMVFIGGIDSARIDQLPQGERFFYAVIGAVFSTGTDEKAIRGSLRELNQATPSLNS